MMLAITPTAASGITTAQQGEVVITTNADTIKSILSEAASEAEIELALAGVYNLTVFSRVDNPAMPEGILRACYDNQPSSSTCEKLGGNPQLPPDLIQKLMEHSDLKVRFALLKNQELPCYVVSTMLRSNSDCLEHALLHEPGVIPQSILPEMIIAAAEKGYPLDALFSLVDCVRLSDEELVNLLSIATDNESARIGLAQNRSFLDDYRDAAVLFNLSMVSDNSEAVRVELAKRGVYADYFVGDPSPQVRHQLARVTSNEQVIRKLASDSDLIVRRTLLRGDLPRDVLMQLHNDLEESVREDAQLRLLETMEPNKLRQVLLEQPKLLQRSLNLDRFDESALDVLAERHFSCFHDDLLELDLPSSVIRKLCNTSSSVTLRGLISSQAMEDLPDVLLQFANSNDEALLQELARSRYAYVMIEQLSHQVIPHWKSNVAIITSLAQNALLSGAQLQSLYQAVPQKIQSKLRPSLIVNRRFPLARAFQLADGSSNLNDALAERLLTSRATELKTAPVRSYLGASKHKNLMQIYPVVLMRLLEVEMQNQRDLDLGAAVHELLSAMVRVEPTLSSVGWPGIGSFSNWLTDLAATGRIRCCDRTERSRSDIGTILGQVSMEVRDAVLAAELQHRITQTVDFTTSLDTNTAKALLNTRAGKLRM